MARPDLTAIGPRSHWLHVTDSDTVVVFVHGFLSSRKECWTYSPPDGEGNDVYWPSLLHTDPSCGNLSVYLAGYYTALTSGKYDLAECADALWMDLSLADQQGRRPPLARSNIVFVCHSFGGVVIRRILVDRSDAFANKRVGLALFASPTKGARFPVLLKPIRMLLRNTVGAQLSRHSQIIEDLDRRFKDLLRRRPFEIVGIERAEHRSVVRFLPPGLGLLVAPDSACQYFDGATTIPMSDHKTIVKPRTRADDSYSALRTFLQQQFPNTRIAEPAPTPFSELISCLDFMGAAEARFGCRWEQSGYEIGHPSMIYWPVRLRRYTPIHASQAFIAAGLQRLGASVRLYVDDLGRREYDVHLFIQKLREWYARAGGDPAGLEVVIFSEFLRDANSEAWRMTQQWLGAADHRLERVLRVSKLIDSPDVNTTELLAQRPRRLLTPSVVWAGLSHESSQNTDASFITLSGIDEIPLWEAWRELGGDVGRRVGHLYLPALITGEATQKRAAHMQRDTIHWLSRDDISDAFRTEAQIASHNHYFDDGRLVQWSLQSCVFLLSYLLGRPLELLVDGVTITDSNQLHDLGYEKVCASLARSLEEALFAA